ncbi:MAG TPA: DUF1778 domain-containing protein [Gammaproteobacteria bacterium]|nr:DUF1778 domain-containing protein [Gammaproteobacteria bacterium]
MATTRIDMRVDEALKAAAEKAAALKGMKSLTEYVVRLIDQQGTLKGTLQGVQLINLD